MLGMGVLSAGCLQQQDLSSDALTSFEAETPGAARVASSEPKGAEANRRILGADAGEPGSGTGEGTAGTGSGSGGPASPEHIHKEMPPGGGNGGTPPAGEPNDGTTHTEVVGAPDAHPHIERPPGYGSNLPAEPKPEAVPLPSGGQPSGPPPGSGEPEKVFPQQETMFEREYKGKKMVTLSGEIVFDGKLDAAIDLDCFIPDKSTPAGRKLVNKVKVHAAGPYSMKVPAGLGKLIVTGFVDLKANGPDSGDPQASYAKNPVEIKDKDVTGVDLVFKIPASARK